MIEFYEDQVESYTYLTPNGKVKGNGETVKSDVLACYFHLIRYIHLENKIW